MGPRPRLIVFARFPVTGKVKTRLIPALGAEGAAGLYRRLVLRTLRTAIAACQTCQADLEIRVADDPTAGRMRQWIGDGLVCRPQCEGDLGERLAGAVADSVHEGAPATVVIGSDCPSLTPAVLASAFVSLKQSEVVLGPATDGGYYLIGLTRARPELFRGVDWGTETVLERSLQILGRTGVRPVLLASLDDLDRPTDLIAWQRTVEAEEADLSRVSVVIPALNEEAHLAAPLSSVFAGRPHEVFVVDGGSADDTCAVARAAGATVISTRPGRARQMNAGAARSTGNVLLFLHADTVLPANWPGCIREILIRPGVVAGSFAFGLAGEFRGRRLVEWTTNLRSRWGQSPYGDQSQCLRRALFEELGGFADLPIMEDYELNRRLRQRGRIATASAVALTSGRRWQQLGILRTTLINKAMIAGFHLGIRPERLARFYRAQCTTRR